MEGGDLSMTGVDNRVVHMQFDNAAFERGVAQTVATVAHLNKSLQLPGAAKGLQGIGAAAAAQNPQLNAMAKGVDAIGGRFTALQQIATGALHNIGARVSESATQMGKALTLGPLIDGFHEYETNLNSIQTILANTQASGADLDDVNSALKDLNHYSDQTIYNFSEMAKNIGTFTAAGVDLDTSAAAIKGIANLAALSGSNSEQAAGAMYQLSQAISAGRVSLEDWNSVVNAGMGGTVFQRALAQNAEKLGTLSKGAVDLKGKMKNVTIEGKSFRESITAKPGEESWLTSKVLTQTLAQFTGDLKDADLAAQGFNKSEIKAIQAQAKTAKEAATQVKTLSQLFDTTKEAIGSGWSQTFETIFGDFTEAKGLFTGASDAIGGIVSSSSDARNKMLSDWKELGGRDALIKGITNGFQALFSVLRPLGDAFREIFPATTAKSLFEMTTSFRDFMERLKLGDETAKNLRRTFAGFFAILGIGWEIIKQVANTILGLFGQMGSGNGDFLELTGTIGDFFVGLHKAVKEGDDLTRFFQTIGKVLALPIQLIQKLSGYLSKIFEGLDSKGAGGKLSGVAKDLEPLGRLGQFVGDAWSKVTTVLGNVRDIGKAIGTNIAEFFSTFGSGIGKVLEGMNFQDVLDGINTGLFAGLVLLLKRALGGGPGGGLGDIIGGVNDAIEGFTKTLSAMQNTLQAAALLQIAIAVGILALSMNTLSKIDAAGLTRASAAISVMFAQLIGSLVVFQKFVSSAGYYKMPFVMASLILLATAVNILASAMTKLADLDWNGIAKGLVGVGGLLAALVAAASFMPNPAGLIATAAGLVILSFAVKLLADAVTELSGLSWEEMARGLVGVGVLIAAVALFAQTTAINIKGFISGVVIALLATAIKTLASALKDLATMSWDEIARGLATMAGALVAISAALKLLPPSTLLSAVGILVVAASLSLIADALQQMSGMSWGEISKGLVTMAGALAIISGVLRFMPGTIPGALALVIVSGALLILARVLDQMSSMSWEEIAKGLVTIAGALAIIAGAMYLMTGALAGAAALLVVSAALAVLTPVLKTLGEMSWQTILLGLGALAGLFGVIALGGLLLAPVTPVLLAFAGSLAVFGAAVLLVGVGIAAAGAGLFLFAAGIAALAAAGATGVAVAITFIGGLASMIPVVMKQVGLGILAFAEVIGNGGPALTKALTTLLDSLIDAIIHIIPKVAEALAKLFDKMLVIGLKYIPRMVDMGLKLLIGFLKGVADNEPKVIDQATRVVVGFLDGISRSLPKIIDAGIKLIINFVNGVADGIRSNSDKMNEAGRNLADAIVDGMVSGISGGIGAVKDAAVSIAKSALDGAKSFLGISSPSKEFEKIGRFVNDGFRKGLDGNKSQVYKAFTDLKQMLTATTRAAESDVDRLNKKLKTLHSASAIKSTKRELTQAKREAAASKAATTELNKSLNDERTTLGKLADKYDVLTTKINKAKDAYNNAIKTRDDYKKSITDQFSDMASPTGEISVAEYTKNLEKQVEDTKVFSNTLQRLRKLGLNDETYKDLLAQGTSALPFVENLLKEGKPAIDEINKLGKELDQAGAALGKTASANLYQAAVDSAKGIVKGLELQQKNIEKQMDKIADAMVRAIKKKLGIKSPSVVFAKVGGFSGEGLAKGLLASTDIVAKSAEDLGTAALDNVRKSLTGFSDLITGDIDTRPTITPVLDLTSFRKDAGQMGSLMPDAQSLSVDAAYAKARYVRDGYASNVAAVETAVDEAAGGSVSYTQNNYSPKALSQADIYRQTKNQLSTVKGALSTSANNSGSS
jgi:tape measure domain-containing protein